MTDKAEIIENEIQLMPSFDALKDGIIAIDAKIKKAMEAASDFGIDDEVLSELDYKDAKRCEQELSRVLTEAENERKAFKSSYNKPLSEIERRYKEAVEPAKALHARYKEQRIAREQEEKDAKEASLKEHYEAYAGLLAPVVPYEKLHDPKWLNRSVKAADAEAELEAKVNRIAADWESLKALSLDFYEQAEAHFFNTLDLGAAVAYNAKLAEDRRKIEEMKAAMAPEPDPLPVEPEPEIADEPAPIADEECAPPAEVAPVMPAPIPVYTPPEPPEPMVMVIDSCTVSQAKEIGRFCGSIGVTGVFKRGSLLDVYKREYVNGRG